MKTRKFVILLLIALTVTSFLPLGDLYNVSAASLQAPDGKLTINNKIGGRIYISFEGPKNYSFWVEEGKTIKEMEQGLYTYSYYADGEAVERNIKLKRSTTLVLKLVRGKLRINNKIGGVIYLSLVGPRDYGFWVPPGKTVMELVPGYYKYTYFAEGGKEQGLINLKKSGATFVMKIDKGILKIKNKYPQNVFISFSGIVPYFYWAPPGSTRLEMRTGTYKYEYWEDGKSQKGSFNIPKKGTILILEPPRVCNCNWNQYDCSDFSTQSQAQECFLFCKGQVKKDIHRLDDDHDGSVCKALP